MIRALLATGAIMKEADPVRCFFVEFLSRTSCATAEEGVRE